MEKEVLKDLHTLSNIFENLGYAKEAQVVNEVFVKIAKKKAKKKSSGKNVPNNPSLWASCQAWAKANYDIHPSAYSNAGAARRYKQKGGTWRKASSDVNLRLAQDVTVTPTTTETMPGGAPEQLNVKVEYNPNATYPQVINSIKELIVSGQKDKAHEAYSWHYNNNTALNASQKQVLGEQYTAILNRFKGTTPMSNNLAIDLDKTANGIVAQYINRMKINKSQITKDSQSYIALRKMISSIRDLSLRYTAIEILDSIVNMNAKSGLVE